MIKVKICGITNLRDALAAVDAGCDALGFNFCKKSPRYIRPQAALEIISNLPKSVVKIGVFVDEQEKTIKSIAKLCKLDILQFHGRESPGFCRKFKGLKIIKAFRVKDRLDLEGIREYKTFAYLFDAFSKSSPGGGTGKNFNWELLRHLADMRQPIFLSGGLNARNVRRAIAAAQPDWVDACSCIERSPGKKDSAKVRRFIQAAKGK
ncbi:MAG: phosphoribosylanthranilate isomerase [Candidatus Omnitrophica bacterium]|nr:phosphoribosylanthranilate isomerase [Candidatus Omnitrophota bacterium]